jgi:hypothetical protein
VYALSLAAFKNNFLYTAINRDEFVQQYTPYKEFIDSDYVLLARDNDGQCCGFVFAIPDYLQQRTGGQINRLIIKHSLSALSAKMVVSELSWLRRFKTGHIRMVFVLLFML